MSLENKLNVMFTITAIAMFLIGLGLTVMTWLARNSGLSPARNALTLVFMDLAGRSALAEVS
jgi:hypothetical protein